MTKHLALAALIACVAVTTARVPSWLVAKPGAVAFTSAGDEDAPVTPVCPTAALYREYANENIAKGCVDRHEGLKVIIDAIVPPAGGIATIAKIHAANGSFRGYTALGELLPAIPAGVTVTLARAEGANETVTIAQKQSAELDIGLNVSENVSAVTLRFDPAHDDERDLLVRITSGRYAGRTGWIFARQASVRGRQVNVLTI